MGLSNDRLAAASVHPEPAAFKNFTYAHFDVSNDLTDVFGSKGHTVQTFKLKQQWKAICK